MGSGINYDFTLLAQKYFQLLKCTSQAHTELISRPSFHLGFVAITI